MVWLSTAGTSCPGMPGMPAIRRGDN